VNIDPVIMRKLVRQVADQQALQVINENLIWGRHKVQVIRKLLSGGRANG
jgi:hypothetical protein